MNLDTLTILITFGILFGCAALFPSHEEPGFVYKASFSTRLLFAACSIACFSAILHS